MKTARWPTESLTWSGTGLNYSFRVIPETVYSAPLTVCLWTTLMSVTRPFACGVWTRHCVLSLPFTPRRLIRRGDCVNFHWLIQTATVSASACPKDNGRKQDKCAH